MTLFLDASVILAACGRPAGTSHAIFDLAPIQGWRLLAGAYVLGEVEKNIQQRLPTTARIEWQKLRLALTVVADEWTFPWPVLFPAAKTSRSSLPPPRSPRSCSRWTVRILAA